MSINVQYASNKQTKPIITSNISKLLSSKLHITYRIKRRLIVKPCDESICNGLSTLNVDITYITVHLEQIHIFMFNLSSH